MEAEEIEKSPTPKETRRGFLKKSGKVAAGVAVALPIVMTLSPDKAKAWGSGGHRGRGRGHRRGHGRGHGFGRGRGHGWFH